MRIILPSMTQPTSRHFSWCSGEKHVFQPVYVQFGLNSNGDGNQIDIPKAVKDLKTRLKVTYHLAEKSVNKAPQRNKAHYDTKRREAQLCPGDKALVRNMSPSGKLDNRWESEIYVECFLAVMIVVFSYLSLTSSLEKFYVASEWSVWAATSRKLE